MKMTRVAMYLASMMILLVLIFLTGASTATASPKFKKGVIHVGTATGMTGPWSSIGIWQMRGADDRIRYQNDELGGIVGHRIEHLWADVKNDAKMGIASYHRFKVAKPKPVEISVGNSSVVHALKDVRKKDEILEIAWNANPPQIKPPGWIYWVMPGYADTAVAFGMWLKDNWDYSKGLPTVACMGREQMVTYSQWDNGFKYCEDQGWLKRIAFEVVPYGVMDISTEMKRIVKHHPDFIFSSQIQSSFAALLKEVHKFGLRDTTTVVVGIYDTGHPYMTLGGEAAKGTLGISCFASASETNLPGVKLIQEVHTKYHKTPTIKDDFSYICGWLISDVTIEATRRAIEKVGYENLNGGAVKEALEGIKGYDTKGLSYLLTYGTGTVGRRGNSHSRIVKWDGANWKSASPWYNVPLLLGK